MSRKLSRDEFIEKSNKIHNNSYDYSLVEYKNNRTKVAIICPTHGIFYQTPTGHINGKKCFQCNNCFNLPLSNYEFIERARKVECHIGKNYDYSKTCYISMRKKVVIICPQHGEFIQSPHGHIRGHGCPVCRCSKGEKIIENFLCLNNIKYTRQYRFKNCCDVRQLPFDFYIPCVNTVIEFQGEQHFKIYKHFGGKEKFENVQYHDNIKKQYCIERNIKLIEIRYDEDIKEKLRSCSLWG